MQEMVGQLLDNNAFKLTTFLVGVACALVSVGILIWIYRDADDRKAKPVLWVSVGAVASLAGALLGWTFQGVVGYMAVGILMMVFAGVVAAVYRVVRPVDFAEDALERDLALHLLRVELESKACPRCGHAVESDYLLCPTCGLELRRPCTYCGRANKANWAACPYCGTRKGA